MEATPRGARIELNNFSWHHPGRPEPVISGLNLTINPGEKVLLLGTSGAGKSTLLHAIAGVLHDDDGESAGGTITINGQAPAEARGTAGMMQQDPESSIVMATVGNDVAFGPENLRVPREEIWGRVTEALTAVGLNHLPLDHPSSALSGGQKQRLGLAGILSMHPGAMILDEPTANLDPSGVQEVRDSILTAAQATGATLLVVEHRVSIWAPHMDRIIVLGEGGTITHDGAPDTVLTEARQDLIDAGVWVPNYVPRAPQSDSDNQGGEHGEALLRAENLSITRAQPTPKQRRARRRTIKRLGDTPAPVPTDLPVLRSGINLTLHAGEHLSVLGPNGAGKSTLALTLAGLLTAPDGTLTATDALRNYDGERGSNSEDYRWLMIPADKNGKPDTFMHLRAVLLQPELREAVLDRAVADMPEPSKTRFREALSNILELFAREGYVGINQFVENKIPAAEQDRMRELFYQMLFGAGNIALEQALSEQGLDWPQSEERNRFLINSFDAYTGLTRFSSPVLLQLNGYNEVKSSGLQMTRSPGQGLVYLGSVLLILGTALMFYLREQRAWLLYDNGQARFAMSSARLKRQLEPIFATHTQHLTRLAQELNHDQP